MCDPSVGELSNYCSECGRKLEEGEMVLHVQDCDHPYASGEVRLVCQDCLDCANAGRHHVGPGSN